MGLHVWNQWRVPLRADVRAVIDIQVFDSLRACGLTRFMFTWRRLTNHLQLQKKNTQESLFAVSSSGWIQRRRVPSGESLMKLQEFQSLCRSCSTFFGFVLFSSSMIYFLLLLLLSSVKCLGMCSVKEKWAALLAEKDITHRGRLLTPASWKSCTCQLSCNLYSFP